MKNRIINRAFILCLLILSCKEDETKLQVVACFTSPSNVVRNEIINFDASCSQNGDKYFWDFGDGVVLQGKTVQHTYKSNGQYSVKLRTENGEAKDSITNEIAVNLTANDLSCKPAYLVGAKVWPFNEIYDSIAFSYSNKKISDMRWFINGKSILSSHRMQFEYNANSVLVKLNVFSTVAINPLKENLVSSFYLKYGSNQLLSRIDYLNARGDSLRSFRFGYDKKDRIIELISKTDYLSPNKTEYEYGLDGNTARVYYTSTFSLGNHQLVRVNKEFDSSLPFYASTPELRVFFERVIQAEPCINNVKSCLLYQALSPKGYSIYYGEGSLNDLKGISLDFLVTLGTKGLINGYSAYNYSGDFPTVIQYKKVGYVCEN